MTVSFQDARKGLMQFEMCGFGFARSTMASLKHIFTIYRAIYETYPGKYKKMLKSLGNMQIECVESGRDLDHLRSEIIDVLASLFPVNEDWMFEVMQEDEDALVPEAIGPYMIWDDFEEFINEPENWNNSPYWSLMMFLTCVDHIDYLDLDEQWAKIKKYFGWPEIDVQPLPDEDYIDMRKFRKQLAARGLDGKGFDLAQQMVWRDTGNYFYDFEPENEPYACMDLDIIKELIKQGRQASQMAERIQPAVKMIEEDNTILRVVYAAYLASATPRPKSKGDRHEEE
jgi:hypothetical protein